MIRTFGLRNFRCFKQLTIKRWERLNLIAGRNNVGKTALLEAIWLHEGCHNAQLALQVENFRGISTFDVSTLLTDLFTQFRTEKTIQLEAQYGDGTSLSLEVFQEQREEPTPVETERPPSQSTARLSPSLVFEAIDGHGRRPMSEFYLEVDSQGRSRFLSSPPRQQLRPTAILVSTGLSKRDHNRINSERFSQQVTEKRKEEIVKALQLIDDRLVNLELVKRGPETYMYADIKGHGHMLPLSLMGEGMERYVTLVLSILSAQKGTVLIDEIENGFHHSIYAQIWKSVAQFARKYDVQIIATTHHYQCIEAAHTVLKEDGKHDFMLHRLQRVGEDIEHVIYDEQKLEAALSGNLEVR